MDECGIYVFMKMLRCTNSKTRERKWLKDELKINNIVHVMLIAVNAIENHLLPLCYVVKY